MFVYQIETKSKKGITAGDWLQHPHAVFLNGNVAV